MFSRVAGAKSSLHFSLVYFRQPQLETIAEYLLVVGWLGETPFADLDAAASWQDDIHHAELRQLIQNAAGLAAKARLLTHLSKRLP